MPKFFWFALAFLCLFTTRLYAETLTNNSVGIQLDYPANWKREDIQNLSTLSDPKEEAAIMLTTHTANDMTSAQNAIDNILGSIISNAQVAGEPQPFSKNGLN